VRYAAAGNDIHTTSVAGGQGTPVCRRGEMTLLQAPPAPSVMGKLWTLQSYKNPKPAVGAISDRWACEQI
jgi:hypothetical protein